MAWGYWSATSVDRGRSPRREKDKQAIHHQQLQQQPQQYQTQDSLQGCSSLQQVQAELDAVASEDPPCSRMIQGGSFYSYSAAAAAVAAAATERKTASSADQLPGGIHVFPRDLQARPGTSNYTPSPGSDSAEYEQPIAHINNCVHHEDPRDVLVQTSSRVKLLRDDGDDEISEAELEDIASADVIYASNSRLIRPGSSGCLVHGDYNPPNEMAPSLPSFVTEHAAPSSSQFWFNDITWGMSS